MADEPVPRRQVLRRQATVEEIKQRCRKQLSANGPGGLSLRAVARDMGLSSAAVYRYFPNLADVITALCIDAYTALSEVIEQACRPPRATDMTDTMWHVLQQVRRWALSNTADFALIFGTPVPGYHAPESATGPAAGRAIIAIVGLYADAIDDGAAYIDDLPFIDPLDPGPLATYLFGTHPWTPPAVAAAAVHSAWVSILGFITSELWGNLTRLATNTDALFAAHLQLTLRSIGFQPHSLAEIASRTTTASQSEQPSE